MAEITYKGQQISLNSSRDVADILQLLATDLGEKHLRDNNRDSWIKSFAFGVSAEIEKLKKSASGLVPVSVASLFTSRPTPAPVLASLTAAAVPTSPHRVPSPTANSLTTALPTIGVSAESTDRAHLLTLDFTAAFNATTNVGEVVFKQPYSSPPSVYISQLDTLTNRNFRVVGVTATGYVFTCDAFAGAEVHQAMAIVMHPTED